MKATLGEACVINEEWKKVSALSHGGLLDVQSWQLLSGMHFKSRNRLPKTTQLQSNVGATNRRSGALGASSGTSCYYLS